MCYCVLETVIIVELRKFANLCATLISAIVFKRTVTYFDVNDDFHGLLVYITQINMRPR